MCVGCRQRPAHHTTPHSSASVWAAQRGIVAVVHRREQLHRWVSCCFFPYYVRGLNARNETVCPGCLAIRWGPVAPRLVPGAAHHFSVRSPTTVFVNPRQAISCLLRILTPFHWKLPMLAVIGKGAIAPSSWCPPSASSGSASVHLRRRYKTACQPFMSHYVLSEHD